MNIKRQFRYITIFSLLIFISSALFLQPNFVDAQQANAPFLITPYYGSETIKAYFDHEYPTYAASPNNENNTFMRYDGAYWQNVPKSQCQEEYGNCYDGHNGYDFGLSYERTLAAADGSIIDKGWYDEYCHDCGYGLEIRIRHVHDGQTYRTRYGHLTTISVSLSQSVMAGKVIGTSGSTGSSTGPHLHFDVTLDNDRAIDPFGWTGAGSDPWANNASGATSWCMWVDGEWVNHCDPSRPSHPIPTPLTGEEFILNDTTNNSNGFSKGFGGRWNNICTGTGNNGCQNWWEANTGWGGHTYYSVADGGTVEDNWARWATIGLPGYSEIYEIFVYIPSIPGLSGNTFTWNAKFTVVDAAGRVYETIVDEAVDGEHNHNPRDKWLSIGTYYLNQNSYIYNGCDRRNS